MTSPKNSTVWTAAFMDPGTIIAVVTTSATILSLITNYYSDVKGATEGQKRLHNELKALHHVLVKAQYLAEGPNASKVPALSSYLKESCSSDLKDLEAKLYPGKHGKIKKKLGVLKWPFEQKEVDKYINRIERHKSTISNAVGIDQT